MSSDTYKADPAGNCHLNVKSQKLYIFSKKIAKNCNFLKQNCQWQLKKKTIAMFIFHLNLKNGYYLYTPFPYQEPTLTW